MRTSLFLIFLVGCDDGAGKCVPGQTAKCACSGGSDGSQVCLDSGRFGACQCVAGGTTSGGTTSGGTTSGGTTSGGTTSGGTTSGGTTSGGTTGNNGGAPEVLSLTSNVSTMHPGDSIIITAVVTHPGGIAQIIGGKLSDPNGGTYGSFGVSTIAGSWSVTLTWSAINMVAPVNTPVGGGPRSFVAEFYDQAGHSTTQSLSVQMTCTNSQLPICNGDCINVDNDAKNCGGCGLSCASFGQPLTGTTSCRGGACQIVTYGNVADSCTAWCETASLGCVAGGDYAKYISGVSQAMMCDQIAPAFRSGTTDDKLIELQCVCQ
jgi:hypothetical protein